MEPTANPRAVHDLFSSIAPKYDLLNSVLSLRQDRRWRREAVRFLTDSRYPRVLDLCAGTLALTEELLRVQPETEVTALDFSRPMLERGLRRLSLPLRRKVTTLCADFFEWTGPHPDPAANAGWFDAALCAYGLRNLRDNRLALQRLHTLLRHGGRLVILEFFRPDRWYTWLFNKTYAEFVIPTVGRLISRHPAAYRHLRDTIRGFYSLDDYLSLLRETGFSIREARRQSGGISGLIVADKE